MVFDGELRDRLTRWLAGNRSDRYGSFSDSLDALGVSLERLYAEVDPYLGASASGQRSALEETVGALSPDRLMPETKRRTCMALLVPGYHISLVVEDVPQAMAELGDLLGLEWSPLMNLGATTFAYSKQGPPYLEVIQRTPGTVFEELGLNHIGVWVDDMRAESERLAERGCPLESVSKAPDGEWRGGCFHRTTSGLRVELVQIGTSGPKLLRFLSGGEYV